MTMLRSLAIAALALAALLPVDALADGRLGRVRQAGTVRVCIWPDYYSISYRNTRTGRLEGIDIDLAHEFAKDLDVAVQFVDSSFRTLIDDLLTDKCDVSMHGVGITPQRQAKLAFSRPHLTSGIYAITTKASPVVREWGDIDRDGVVVVAHAGTFMVDVMKSTLKHARLEVVQTPEAREQEVMSGRADVFMTDYPYTRKMLARHDWAKLLAPPQPLAPTDYGYAVAPGDGEWLQTVDGFVARAKTDGRLIKAAKANGLEAIVNLE